MIDYLAHTPAPGTLAGLAGPVGPAGPGRPDEPLHVHVHTYNEHTLVLRQNKSVHFEAPFLFLLFGNERALLLDTGATADPALFPLRATVDREIAEWLARHPREEYGLLVAHTHGHGDHIAADGQFEGRPHTTVVGPELAAVTEAFGLDAWPEGLGTVDLGGRIIDVVPGPGHQDAAVVFHDRYTGLLLTGDSLYPGRLYVNDADAYGRTVDRLLGFCGARDVTHVLGCHIEMTTTPDVEYPRGTVHQPDEAPLALTTAHLRTLRRALDETGGRPGSYPYGDFVLVHEGPTRTE
ncbi:MBL fold metallo-hydrolase [Streptomyces sp. NPDC087420]|uniref:MBL fold metallo-hydrolase n=1 Tax=Streptomyces sp. NPDC087420 TaxID=3365785 RepID=UPI003833E969